jgi:hypothetical protein
MTTIVLLAIGIAIFVVPAILIIAAAICGSNFTQGKTSICSEATRLGYEAGEDD